MQVVCRLGAFGPNVALSALDVSEAGARLSIRLPLPLGQEVEIEFSSSGRGKPVKGVAEVVWCVATTETAFQVGLRFRQYLSYHDLQELGR